jgi:alpha-galactosidase
MTRRWTLRMATTTYTVGLPEHEGWLEHISWGPAGIEDGPSPVANTGRTPYLTEPDGAPVEYAPFGLRPFTGADLVAGRPGAERESFWRFDGEDAASPTGLRLAFVDDVTGLRVVLCYCTDLETDVLLRWVELTNGGDGDLRLERFDSAGFCVPVTPKITFLTGRWAREFQRTQVVLPAGRFEIGSGQGVAGHQFAPWLAVQDVDDGPAWGVSPVWSGNWRIAVDVELSGIARIRAGRVPHESAVLLATGDTLVTPQVAAGYSTEGLAGLSRVFHRHERRLARFDRPRPVLYNSWEATEFAVEEHSQLELATIAADLGAELFVLDDGWFDGRHDDTTGLGDWTPDPAAFPDGFDAFIGKVRALGLGFGLWVEPESVSPKSRLYAEHPDWVYRIDDRPGTLIRHQLLLDLGREDVFEFVLAMFDRLLTDYPIDYLKWDLNRPPTPRGRPDAGDPERLDLDGAHVRNYLRLLDHLRTAYPDVQVEGCAGGGGRVDLATIARTDVVWPSDNTAPMDRLTIQHGFLHAHAPHVLSSWVTDHPGFFDTRPKSLRFRFVTAMAGVLGIGADIRTWSAEQRAEAAAHVAVYKEIRETIHHGDVHQIGTPNDPSCAVQYHDPARRRTVVLAWQTGDLDGTPALPGRRSRFPLRDLDPRAAYRDTASGATYSGAHLLHAGLPITWTPTHDADVVVLEHLP